jgi:hypothetical protein
VPTGGRQTALSSCVKAIFANVQFISKEELTNTQLARIVLM